MDFKTRKNFVFTNLTPDYGVADDINDNPYAFDLNRYSFSSINAKEDDIFICYRIDATGYVHFEEEIELPRHALHQVPFWV